MEDIQDLDPEAGERIAKAMMPTKGTLFFRKFFPKQLIDMIDFNTSVMASVLAAELKKD